MCWSFVMDDAFLEELFEQHRGAGYRRKLGFATLVGLIRDALLAKEDGARRTFERARRGGRMAVSVAAAYGKLARVSLGLSRVLLREGARQLVGLMPIDHWDAPASLAGPDPVCCDGKTIKHVPHRLKPTRAVRGRLLGGKLQVAQDMRSGLAVAMNACEDAERNEVRLTEGLVAQVRPGRRRPILWVSDRQYSDLKMPRLFARDQGHFLIRYNRTLSFAADPRRPAGEGTDARGRRWVQEWGWVGAAGRPDRLYVRRITLERPDVRQQQQQDGDVILITDLLDERLWPAADLLECYLHRWGIERMFQQVTEVFDLRHLIGTTPRAAIFQSAFCLMLYNIIQVIRGYVAQDGGLAGEQVSGRKLFDDVKRELITWSVIGGDPQEAAAAMMPACSPEQMRTRLRELLHWNDLWRKSKPRTKPSVGGRATHANGGRSSVYKLLQAARDGPRRPERRTPARC
jgi:hypothetical protein